MKKVFSFICIICTLMLSFTSCAGKDLEPMTDDLYEFTFKLDGVSYTLAESIDAFTQNGWEFPDDFDGYNDIIKPNNLETAYFEQGDSWFSVEIINTSDSELALKNCNVGRVTYDFSGDAEICTAGNFQLNGKTLDEVIEKYGEPYSQTDYSLYTEVIYDKDPESGIYDRYTFRFDKDTKAINYIDIIYFY